MSTTKRKHTAATSENVRLLLLAPVTVYKIQQRGGVIIKGFKEPQSLHIKSENKQKQASNV